MLRFVRLNVIIVGLLLLSAMLFQRPTASADGRPFACGPAPTPEIMEVAAVTSPTSALTQTLRVRLGNGRAITATSEAGSVVITGAFSSLAWTPITLTLLPNVTHHMIVTGQVEYAADCYYTLYRTTDVNSAPLTIVQASRRVYLPIVARSGGGSQRLFPDTTNGIFVFNDQLATGSMSEAQFQFAATHYAGTQKVTRDQARHLRQYNPDFLVLHYRLGQALGHSTPSAACQPTTDYFNIIDGDQWVQEWPGESNVQDEWFFKYNASRVFSCSNGHYVMELNDAGWRAWWSTQVISQLIDNENDGLFADSYSVPNYFGGSDFNPPLPDSNSTFEQQWADREHAFTDYIRSRFAGRWLWLPNIGAWITSRDPSDYSNLDGAMLEGFAEWGGGSYFDSSDWELQLNRVLTLIRADKIIIGQTYPAETDVHERLFVLGTYLLIKGAHTYINLDTAMEPEWFPEYAIDLGAPLDALPADIAVYLDPTWQVYARHYAHGLVLVNPTDTVHAINLGGTYYRADPIGGGAVPEDGAAPGSLNYAEVTAIDLGPHQAQVVLNQRP